MQPLFYRIGKCVFYREQKFTGLNSVGTRNGWSGTLPFLSERVLYMNENFENEQIEVENTEDTSILKKVRREVFEWVQAIVIAVVLALIIRNFVFTVVRVDGQSMEPTLQHNDRMIVWRVGYEPKQSDIVIFNPQGYDKNIYWVKRVIALEGQHVTIDYSENAVYVDGERIEEAYLGERMLPQQTITDITVPEGYVFVMGDNRNHSTDGRVIGPIKEESIIGRAVLRFWPMNKIETYKRG